MKLFKGESEAREYLEKRMPLVEEEKEADLAPLKEQLFEIPEKLSPGHYEFEGKNGLKVSFDLFLEWQRSQSGSSLAADRCIKMYSGLDSNGDVAGDYSPIYLINNLQIQVGSFSYDKKNDKREVSITWLPNLKSVNSELSHSLTYIDKGEIYLIGKDGFFSTPLDLVEFFHELGHIETRSLAELSSERGSVKTTISSAGVKTEPLKSAALELQRERDANAWMLQKTDGLFKNLEISRELVRDYIHHAQLKSYHKVNRKRLAKSSNTE